MSAQNDPDRLLTDAEAASLETQNRMWRAVRVEESSAANLKRLKAAGFSETDITSFAPELTRLWDVPFERNYGWLREDAVERIQEIDRKFIGQVRASRLFENVGIRTNGETPANLYVINRLWRGALLRALDYDELAEFRLMNSPTSRLIAHRTQGLRLTTDEHRTLLEWQRETRALQRFAAASAGQAAWLRQAQLDEWQRIRDLLGDARFVIYLSRVSPEFEKMLHVLDQNGEVRPSAALDLWWIRKKGGAERDEARDRQTRDARTSKLRVRAGELLGEAQFALYMEDDDSHWLDLSGPARRSRQAAWEKSLEHSRRDKR